MSILLTLFALLLFLIEGFLLVRLLEGKNPILSHTERIAYGFLLGGSVFSYSAFWLVLIGLPLTFAGMLIVHILLLLVLGGFFLWRLHGVTALRSPLLPVSPLAEPKSRWLSFLIAWCVVWTLVKVVAGGYDLLSTPSYFNDTYASWNMRAKVFFVEESLLLGREPTDEYFFGGRVPSYPLTVHLSKVWIAKTVGNWNESAVNSIHLFWFLALLGIFFSALKRELNAAWAIAGTAALVSLPLLLVHGVNAYSDVLMGGFVFAALYGFYRWMRTESTKSEARNPNDDGARHSWLLIFSFMTTSMLFVKNEALLIFLPTIAFLFAFVCWSKGNPKTRIDFSDFGFRISDFVTWLLIVSSVVVPWTLFKWSEGLTFGNATEVSGFSLHIHDGVAFAVEGDLLYTGSYLLFFPLFALLLFMGWRFYMRKSLGVLVTFFLIVFLGEFCIYLLTPLATEAIRHTGFGRGMVHILPVGMFISMLIVQKYFSNEWEGCVKGKL